MSKENWKCNKRGCKYQDSLWKHNCGLFLKTACPHFKGYQNTINSIEIDGEVFPKLHIDLGQHNNPFGFRTLFE
jgi:hypothetical protein